jgi:hypothetical protein
MSTSVRVQSGGGTATLEAGADGIDLLVWAWEIHETSLFELQPERLP